MTDTGKSLLMYKGKPLIRKDKILCYGNKEDKYILIMTILETKELKGLEIATKVLVQIQKTDDSIISKDRVVKSIEKPSLYEAFDIGEIWLERFLAE